jgi:predicted nucleotidyltransferase
MAPDETEIRQVLTAFREAVHAALGENLVAIYVDGSLTMGDFEPASSDLDFLVVVREPPAADEIRQLDALHRRLARESPWGTRLEGEYAAQRQLRPSGIEGPAITVEPESGLMPDVQNRFTAENVVAIREHGLVLYGPPPASVLPPVDRATLEAALRAYLSELLAPPRPDELSPGLLASRVLNVARCLYGVETGRPCTKTSAARWLGSRAPTLRPILSAALAVRRGVASPEAARLLSASFDELARAARVVLDR